MTKQVNNAVKLSPAGHAINDVVTTAVGALNKVQDACALLLQECWAKVTPDMDSEEAKKTRSSVKRVVYSQLMTVWQTYGLMAMIPENGEISWKENDKGRRWANVGPVVIDDIGHGAFEVRDSSTFKRLQRAANLRAEGDLEAFIELIQNAEGEDLNNLATELEREYAADRESKGSGSKGGNRTANIGEERITESQVSEMPNTNRQVLYAVISLRNQTGRATVAELPEDMAQEIVTSLQAIEAQLFELDGEKQSSEEVKKAA